MSTILKLQGKNGEAKVFTDLIEETAVGQVIGMLNEPITENATVRIMPDVHAGKGSTVGTTIELSKNFDDWKVSPNVVGVDVGCGIMMYKIEGDINLEKLDKVINDFVPSGFNIHNRPQNGKLTQKVIDMLTLELTDSLKTRIHNSLGTLGGGNHFIELGVDGEGNHWLSVHSGSRNLGLQVAQTHQKIAQDNKFDDVIQKDFAYLSNENLKAYLNDMEAAQIFAENNRKTMLDIIVKHMDWKVVDKFDSIHNFIETRKEFGQFVGGTIRKGATSAKTDERLVIPLNMRDGMIIGSGKGNVDWNNSAPHGAGRILSRSAAKKQLSLETMNEQMKDVYTTSVMQSTLDEAPDAYKPAQSIIDNIGDSVDIVHIVVPIYNYKAH